MPALRYVPERTFPPYTYVPGRQPHPVSHPQGHSYGQPHAGCAAFSLSAVAQSNEFLWGLDLYNAGYYWESHEAWESCWKTCPVDSPAARFLKGLIKLAAAGVKAYEGNDAGWSRHLTRSRELFLQLQRECVGCPLAGSWPALLLMTQGVFPSAGVEACLSPTLPDLVLY